MYDITIVGDSINIENEVALGIINPPWFLLLLVGYQLNKKRMEPIDIKAILYFNLFRSLSF